MLKATFNFSKTSKAIFQTVIKWATSLENNNLAHLYVQKVTLVKNKLNKNTNSIK